MGVEYQARAPTRCREVIARVNNMAIIEGIRIRNYRVLRDITLGRLWNTPDTAPLTPMTAVIGKNGVGKSSLFDAFGFLADCLKLGVEEACDERRRGGFDRIRSQGSEEPITFDVCYREEPTISALITLNLAIETDPIRSTLCLARSTLQQEYIGENGVSHAAFMLLSEGIGFAWSGNERGTQGTRIRGSMGRVG